MATIIQKKAALRKEVNALVNALSEDEISRQSNIVTQMVLQHPHYQQAKSVSIYLSFDKEIQTDSILQDIFKSGKTCYIPRFRKGIPDMEMIKLNSLEDYNSLPVNKWNIKQPPDSEERESVFDAGSLDLVLSPGLAFTAGGRRLGRGKGYYDGFLNKCGRQLETRPTTLALAFSEQVIPDLPVTETDVKMDHVLYPRK